MGIQGLLPLLKSIMVPIHVKDLEGCSVAVDTYSWLHKGALSCSKDLCKGLPTSKHIDYCMHRVNLLRHHGVKPVLVFDGGLLPMKSEQENKRGRSRKENLARAVEHESSGNASAAYECYQKAVDISPSVAYELIQVLKQENVSYVVAPYEADAQMTFLAVSKQVDAVVTEDSDLIPFGCPRILYKMDKFGQGVEFRSSLLQHNKELSFTGFNSQMILEMCILSGCDYLSSLPGMGLKKAHALTKKFKSYDKVIKHLKYSGVAVPVLYEESFKKAIMTFQHQRVFDPFAEDIVHLSEPSDNFDKDLDFLGPLIPQHIAKGIAVGDIDPLTRLPFQASECAREGLLLDGTYYLKSFKAGGERKKLDLPAQKNLLTNYFCIQIVLWESRKFPFHFQHVRDFMYSDDGFASLEAKRRFRAPRTSPKFPTSTRESLSPQLGVDIEANDCNMNSSPASENLDISPTTKDSADNIASGTCYVLLESPSHGLHVNYIGGDMGSAKQSTQLIHPCIALQKARDCSSASNSDNEKTRIEKKDVIVRSSYIMNKSKRETGQDIGDESTGLCERPVSDTEHKSSLDISDGNMRNNEVGKSDTQYESMSPIQAVEGKILVAKKKVVVSRYFKHQSIKENDKENLHEEPSRMDDFTSAMKRKVDLSDTENLNHKYMRTSDFSLIQNAGSSNADLDPVIEPRAEEGKFGCNISHLGQYSDIAEKSIEKFVEVISSFRCNSSGSRASGLRAPLKDIRNISTTRRTSDNKDLSKFSYVPTSRKAPPASRRC